MESVQALPGRLEAFLQARRTPSIGTKAARQPLLASKLRADSGEVIRVRRKSTSSNIRASLNSADATSVATLV